MLVEEKVAVSGSRAAIWEAITDIENAPKFMTGIEQIEILKKPENGLVGMRWNETRLLFGKPATVEKWITDAKENEFYATRAEDRGLAFLTTMRISEGPGGFTLTSSHDSHPQTLAAKVMSTPMVLFKGVMRKAILQDLNDIKSAVERK